MWSDAIRRGWVTAALALLCGCVAFSSVDPEAAGPPPNNGGNNASNNDQNNDATNNGLNNIGDWSCDLMCEAVLACLSLEGAPEPAVTPQDCEAQCVGIEEDLRATCFDDNDVECRSLLDCAQQFDRDALLCEQMCMELDSCATELHIPVTGSSGACIDACGEVLDDGMRGCFEAGDESCGETSVCLKPLLDALLPPCESACVGLAGCTTLPADAVTACVEACETRAEDWSFIGCVEASARVCASAEVCVSDPRLEDCAQGCRKQVLCGEVSTLDGLNGCIASCEGLGMPQKNCYGVIGLPVNEDIAPACAALDSCADAATDGCSLYCFHLEFRQCPHPNFAEHECIAECRTASPSMSPVEVDRCFRSGSGCAQLDRDCIGHDFIADYCDCPP